MPQLDPYLTFSGDCAEAMRFYERTLGGRLESLMIFGDSPMAQEVPPAAAHLVMHARLVLGDRVLMASDAMPGQTFEGMKGFSLSLFYETAEEGRRIFEALSPGGQVTMPMQKTFWAESFGMFTDRFGTPWMINAGMPPM
jgi:PhnB protein